MNRVRRSRNWSRNSRSQIRRMIDQRMLAAILQDGSGRVALYRGLSIEDRRSRIEDRESKIEDRGSRCVVRLSVLDLRSSIFDPRSSILDPQSLIQPVDSCNHPPYDCCHGCCANPDHGLSVPLARHGRPTGYVLRKTGAPPLVRLVVRSSAFRRLDVTPPEGGTTNNTSHARGS